MGNFNKFSAKRISVLTAITFSLLKCGDPKQGGTQEQDKNVAQELLRMCQENGVSGIKIEHINSILAVLKNEYKKFNASNIKKFIDILYENEILIRNDDGSYSINEKAFKKEKEKITLNENVINIEELQNAIDNNDTFKLVDVNVLKENLKNFFQNNFQTNIDDIVDDLANFLSNSKYFDILYIEDDYENKEAIKNVFVKNDEKDNEIGLVLVDDKKINEESIKDNKLTEKIKKEIEEKLKALIKEEHEKKHEEEEPKKELKKIDDVAEGKGITYDSTKGFTSENWKNICSENKFSFEDIKKHLPDGSKLKKETVMNILKAMDDISVDNILAITGFCENKVDVAELLGLLKENSFEDFVKLNGEDKHDTKKFLNIIDKFKFKLSYDDAIKLRDNLESNLSIDEFKNKFSKKLDNIEDNEYNELIINYCKIDDVKQITIPPFKNPVSFNTLKGFDKSKKISDLNNFVKVFGQVSKHDDYEIVKEFVQSTSDFQTLISIFKKGNEKGLIADDIYDIWNNLFTGQVDFDPNTHKALIGLAKDGESIDNSKFKSKKATITFTEWLNSTDNAVICAIDKVGFTDDSGNAIKVDDDQMKSALDKINGVKTDTKLDKDKIVTFITNAGYQDKLNKDHIGVLKNIFDTNFKEKVLDNSGYTKFNVTIKDFADTIGNQNLNSGEIKTLFKKCTDWSAEKVKADIVDRINTVSGSKTLKHVFEVLSNENLTAANAYNIAKACGTVYATPNDLATALVAPNGGLNAFITALKKDEKKISKVFAGTALGNGSTLTAKNAFPIAVKCNGESGAALTSNDAKGLAAELAIQANSLNAFFNALKKDEKKISVVFADGALGTGSILTAKNAFPIAVKCYGEMGSALASNDAEGLAAELAIQANSLNAFFNALKSTEKTVGNVFTELKDAKLTAADAKTILGACSGGTSASIAAARTQILDALTNKNLSTVFSALAGANLTAEHAVAIGVACNKDSDNGAVTDKKGLATELAAQTAALNAFITALKKDEKKISKVFAQFANKNLTAANAAKIACALNATKTDYDKDGKKELVDHLTNPTKQDDLEYFFKALKANDEDTMAKVSGALRDITATGAEYTLAQVLKILVHCSDFKDLTADMKANGDEVTLSKTMDINNPTSLALANVFGSIIGNSKNNPEKSLGTGDPNSNEFNGQKMFTAWELARIIAQTTDKAITTANAAIVLNCLQDEYRKLDIVFYELANCKVGGTGNYDFSDKNKPDPKKVGKFSIEVCLALAKVCLKADKDDSSNAGNLMSGLDGAAIFTIGNNEGKYDYNYCKDNTKSDRYEGLWIGGKKLKKDYFKTNCISDLGRNDGNDAKKTLYGIIACVCNVNVGKNQNDLDFSQGNWTAS